MYHLKKISYDEFSQMKLEWNTLLKGSDGNTLFLTWEWLHTWWLIWHQVLNIELNIIACYSQNNVLLGIAPLYKSKSKFLKIFNSVRLCIIGASYKSLTTVRSEFQDFIVDSSDPVGLRKELIKGIYDDRSWDELIFHDVRNSSYTFALFTINELKECPSYTRVILKDHGVYIDTSKDFNGYLSSLGRNTRNSAFNKRERLKTNYEYCIEVDTANFVENMNYLNQFHILRWGKECFDKSAERFHALIFENQDAFSSSFLKIKVNNKLVSLSYNIEYMGKVKNIQLGFCTFFDKKFALGNLNLGEAIKLSFENDKVVQFDMLLGSGQNTFYKERFKGQLYLTSTFQIIRNPFIALVYKSYDRLTELFK